MDKPQTPQPDHVPDAGKMVSQTTVAAPIVVPFAVYALVRDLAMVRAGMKVLAGLDMPKAKAAHMLLAEAEVEIMQGMIGE